MEVVNDNRTEDKFNLPALLYHDIEKALNKDEQIMWLVQPKLRAVVDVLTGLFLLLLIFSLLLYGLISLVVKGQLLSIGFIIIFMLTVVSLCACKEGLLDAFRRYGCVYIVTNQAAMLVKKTKEGNKVRRFSEEEIKNCRVVKGILGKRILFSEIDISTLIWRGLTTIRGVGFDNLNSEEFCQCMSLLCDLPQSEQTGHS